MKRHHSPILPSDSRSPEARDDERKGLYYALGLHGLIFLAIVLNLVFSTPKSAGPVQIELWAEGDLDSLETKQQDTEQPNIDEAETESTPPEDPPASEPTETPEPSETPNEPEPEADTPPSPTPEPTPSPTQAELDAEIALAEKRKQAEAEKKAKLEAEQKAKAEAEAKAKAEAEKKAKLEAEQKAKAEAEAKAKAEADKKAKAEAEAKAKAEAEKKAKAAADQKAKAAAAEKAKQDAFKKAMLGAGSKAGGAPGGTADRNQRGGAGGDDGYSALVRACIRRNVTFNAPPRKGANPTLRYRAAVDSAGRVSQVRITQSSGNAQFDDAVQKGINKCSPLPKPPQGRYPSSVEGRYQMYD
ncbi:MAG TPA: cell envelope integrity protein TolA [Candidatus Paenalcaligenes intestinipullorum]|uniref:Cell envelope integrity protein TolA n=1 Tax=Candidatus Paenalcaligenes intestinipullorum TaxID=2838718 RepID=A0A9D2RGV1_9BURK|nr:cell envelope integrity protein TolA [Candidatus Paenalcaligenes intestinipullorum]